MTELPGQISRDDDLHKQRNILASHRNSFDKGLTKSDSLHHSVISSTIGFERRASILNNRTNQVDRRAPCLNKFEPEDNRKINNLYKKNPLLRDKGVSTRYYNNLAEPNNDIRGTRIKFNVSTPSENTKGKEKIIRRPSNIPLDFKPSRSVYDTHQVSLGYQEDEYNNIDDDDDDDDDDDEDDDEDDDNLCKGDVANNRQETKREDGDKQNNEELEERRWAEKVLKDRKHRTNEVAGTRKLYQRGRMSEAASRREMIRLMQNSIMGDSLRKSLHTNQETGLGDRMEVSSVESLTWEERPMTPISSDSQEEDSNHEESISEPTPLSQSENSLASTSETHTQTFPFSHPYRFQYFIDVPDQLDILEPAEQGTPIKCHIIKYTNGMVRNFCPIYYLYVMNKDGVGTFLLAARKRLKCMGSSYVICKDSIDLSRGGSSYVAKLKANLVGTEYRLLCKRCNAENSRRARKSETMVKPLNEIAGIIYEYANILGISNPETLTVVIPRLNSCQERMEILLDDGQEGLIERWHQNDLDDIIEMPNRKPWINEQTNKYELNFYGRSPEFSYKNFQILCDDSIALQVGQIDKDLFFMDFQYPLCTLQAFAIALSCFDRK